MLFPLVVPRGHGSFLTLGEMKVIPYPPLTVLRLTKLWPHARKQGHEKGDVWRVGYYSKQDGLDCIWLVDKDGKYDWTAEADWIRDQFEVVQTSSDRNYFGKRRARIGSLTKAELKEFTKIGKK